MHCIKFPILHEDFYKLFFYLHFRLKMFECGNCKKECKKIIFWNTFLNSARLKFIHFIKNIFCTKKAYTYT